MLVRITTVSVLVLLLVNTVNAADRVPRPEDAMAWVIADLAALPPEARASQRYLWMPPWASAEWSGALDFVMNSTVSHSRVLQKGRKLARGWLLAYDMRTLVPDPKQRIKTLKTWDDLAIHDPYFHVPVDNTGVKAAVLAPHIGRRRALLSVDLTASAAPVYRADWFLVKATSTLDNGAYYDFRQIARNPNGKTAQQAYLESRGVFEDQIEKLLAENRGVLLRSNVTGKQRMVSVVPMIRARGGFATVTHDMFDEDKRDVDFSPLKNLLTGGQDRAREIILPLDNGLIEGTLFNDAGALQDSVPENIAIDREIPRPHTARLQPISSCWRCHGPADGYIQFDNVVDQLKYTRLDVLDDLDGLKLTQEQVVDNLAALYGYGLNGADDPLGRNRRGFSLAAFQLTGRTAAAVTNTITNIYHSYSYEVVTPSQACLELGLRIDPFEDETSVVQYVIPENSEGNREDAFIGLLRGGVRDGAVVAGKPLPREVFELVYADLAIRAKLDYDPFRFPDEKKK